MLSEEWQSTCTFHFASSSAKLYLHFRSLSIRQFHNISCSYVHTKPKQDINPELLITFHKYTSHAHPLNYMGVTESCVSYFCFIYINPLKETEILKSGSVEYQFCNSAHDLHNVKIFLSPVWSLCIPKYKAPLRFLSISFPHFTNSLLYYMITGAL